MLILKNKLLITLILYLTLFTGPAVSKEKSISYSKPVVKGTEIHLITVNLNDPNVCITPIVPDSFDAIEDIYPLTDMEQIIKLYSPDVLINGTYFDMNDGRPLGNIIIDGNLINEGYNGSALSIDKKNHLNFILFTGCIGRYLDKDIYKSLLCSSPTLVYKGRAFYFNNQEGHDDPGLYRNTKRSILGITEDNKLLIAGIDSNISLKEAAFIMVELGAYYACNLDGGTSCGLYYDRKYLIKPGRAVSNFLAVFNNKPDNLYIPPSLTEYFEKKERKESEKLSEEGKDLYETAYYYDALEYFIEACEKDQSNGKRYLDIAKTYKALGEEEEESKFIAKAAMVYLQRGFTISATFYANKALKIDRENKIAGEVLRLKNYNNYTMACLYMFKHKYLMAKTFFLKAIKEKPPEPRFYYGLAGAYWKLGLKEKASETFLFSYELFIKKGLPYDAYCAALNGVRANPHSKEARVALASIAIKRKKYDTAIVHLQIACMLDPKDPEIVKLLNNLGVYVPE